MGETSLEYGKKWWYSWWKEVSKYNSLQNKVSDDRYIYYPQVGYNSLDKIQTKNVSA